MSPSYRPPAALLGYHAATTERALTLIARTIAERDAEIEWLRKRLAEARPDAAAGAPIRPRPTGRRAAGPGTRADPFGQDLRQALGRQLLRMQARTDDGRLPAAGPDGLLRCPWSLATADYLTYHDEEWGRPVRDDTGMFERLCLEAFQSGLSWLTILRKRENFRLAFRGFDIEAVAGFGPGDISRLLADAGIVRNRAKIEAAVANARAALELPAGLAELVWQYARGRARPAPVRLADVPSRPVSQRRCRRNCARPDSGSPGRSPPTPRCRRAAS